MLLGMWEIVLVLAVALIVLGPEKMPEAARTLARALQGVRRVADEIKQNIEDVWVEPQDQVRPRPAPVAPRSHDRPRPEASDVSGPSTQQSPPPEHARPSSGEDR